MSCLLELLLFLFQDDVQTMAKHYGENLFLSEYFFFLGNTWWGKKTWIFVVNLESKIYDKPFTTTDIIFARVISFTKVMEKNLTGNKIILHAGTWWLIPVIPILLRQRQEDLCDIKAILV